MIGRDYVRTMAEYNAEMNRRMFAAAGRLSDAERRRDGGAFWKSIHGTLNHVLWADRMWLSRFGVGTAPEVPIAQSDWLVEEFAALEAARAASDAEILGWAETLTPEAFEGDLVWFSRAAGREMKTSRALCILHLFNHQTHHRGQVHALLTRAGEDTGATDLPFVL